MIRRLPLTTLTLVAALLEAFEEDDTGACCQGLSDEGRAAIPHPETAADGTPRDRVARHPAFDCSALACVSWDGSPAFCSKKCQKDDGCPEGFICRAVLDSDPGEGAPIGPDDKFCVRTDCSNGEACPEESTCQDVTVVKVPGEPERTVRQCVRTTHTCAE